MSVIVVNWNGGAELLTCAASVFSQAGVSLELVVVDNGSRDESVARLRAAHPATRILETGENLGFAEGCNRGIAASSAPWVLLLNNDATLDPGALACLLRHGRDADSEVAALQPKLVFKDRPERLNSTGILLFSDGYAKDRSFGRRDVGAADPEVVFGVTAGAALFRRSALDRVALRNGIFDGRLFMYFEDVDLAWRLQLAGYSARYVAQAMVRHRYNGSACHRDADFVGRQCRENRLSVVIKNASKRMLVRGLWRTARDVLQVARGDGLAGLARVGVACRQALEERRRVDQLARVPRRQVERCWIHPHGTGLHP